MPSAPLPDNPASENWETIREEGFGGSFHDSYWEVEDLDGDNLNRQWDIVSSRSYAGMWAVWPARGANGIVPTTGSHYFDNMETRMKYGPFDLSDASLAYVDFYLWLDTEITYDYLTLEVSGDGENFEELKRWSGSAPPGSDLIATSIITSEIVLSGWPGVFTVILRSTPKGHGWMTCAS